MSESASKLFDSFNYAELSRFPDVQAENLFAFDTADQLILRESSAELARLAGKPGSVAVLGDNYGALTLAAAKTFGLTGIKVYQDPLSAETALNNNAKTMGLTDSFSHVPLEVDSFAGVEVLLWQLPKSLDELAESAAIVARGASPKLKVFSAGRIKHMTPSMNQVLANYFANVEASLGWKKSRALRASAPLPKIDVTSFPKQGFIPELGVTLYAHGATFGSTKLDQGTRLLLEQLPRMNPSARTAIDLGCGNGTIATVLAKARPELSIIATDQSAAAVASAQATAKANGVDGQIVCLRDDAMASLAADSAELILLNPPFHIGTSVHAGIALKLFDAAARVLQAGGELWTVYNRHLDYRSQLQRRVGPSEVIARNAKFNVIRTTRSDH